MKHITIGILAVVISGAITVSLHFWGAHDMQGFVAAIAGYPGLLANGDYTQLNGSLFTLVNCLFYFLVFEAMAALKRLFSK